MKKFYTFLFLFLITSFQIIHAQGTSIIFDITQYGIESFSSFKINGSGLKGMYMQQGIANVTQGTEGGYYYKLDNNRQTWSSVSFLNAKCCINGSNQSCYPVDYVFMSRINPSIFLFNGFYSCGSPLTGGDYTTLTVDGGLNTITLPFASDNLLQECRGFDIDPTNTQIMYMGHTYFNGVQYNEPRIFKSTNAGVNWFVTDTLPGMKKIKSFVLQDGGGFLRVSPWAPNTIFTVTDDKVVYSTNGGYDFIAHPTLPPFKFIVFDEGDNNYHGIAPDNQIWCKFGNPEGPWAPSSNAFNIISIEVNPDDYHIWYAGSDNNGIYKSINRGYTFFPYNNTFTPSKKVIGISKDANTGDTLIVSTDERVYKVWESFLVSTGEGETGVPTDYILHQNYPNPFNPNTIINYQLSIFNFVKLKVFDVLGNEVSVLVNENQAAGNYSLQFDGNNLPSGIYFYELIANGKTVDTKKMVLMK